MIVSVDDPRVVVHIVPKYRYIRHVCNLVGEHKHAEMERAYHSGNNYNNLFWAVKKESC